jgi:RimJ/RimL family protein N-acetyltransferase
MAMTERKIGPVLTGWTAPPMPGGVTLEGRFVRLDPLDPPRHAAALFAAFAGHDWIWDYLGHGPFADIAALQAVLDVTAHAHPTYVVSPTGQGPLGFASYWTVAAAMGSAEVGGITFSPALQRTRATTEAMYLMMSHAFALGYRRYEWKCNALNVPSRRTAQRLGFSFEGIFRNHMVIKGRSRDTAWFAITSEDWPELKLAFDRWLAPENFDADGHQRQTLASLTAPVLVTRDPAQV